MPASSPSRTLSTAEARRETILQAAERVFAARGLHGTPTIEVAKAAGISQAYVFRLFPTKAELFIALVQRCNERVHRTFASVSPGSDHIETIEKLNRRSRCAKAVSSRPTRATAPPKCSITANERGEGTLAIISTATSIASSLSSRRKADFQ